MKDRLLNGTIKYISSANLNNLLEGKMGDRSDAVIRKEKGPMPDPCTMLAEMDLGDDISFWNRVL